MDQEQKSTSILDSLGEEIIRIIAPVSACMFLVVLLVRILDTSSSSSFSTIATIAYDEKTNDSIWDKLEGALLNSLIFVTLVTAATFLMVILFYFRCTKFLRIYMGFSAFMVLGIMGGEIWVFLIKTFNFPIDCITFLVILYNFSVIGVLSVFLTKTAILITQVYLVIIAMLVAYWFTFLPEWTTWALLIALAFYDLAAVLLPVGPLRLLVELAISRDEDIPALVYEARPVTYDRPDLATEASQGDTTLPRRLWKGSSSISSGSEGTSNLNSNNNPNLRFPSNLTGDESSDVRLVIDNSIVSEISTPLLDQNNEVQLEGIGLSSTGAIKLGLGDFIFYSVLVGRAAMYDFMTVYACYLAIIAGLGITLMLLAFYRKALPALPVSILLGVMFYFLTRLLLECFVFQFSVNLLMF